LPLSPLLYGPGSEAEQLRGERKAQEKKIAELEASITQLKDIAEIATQQAQTMSDFRDNYEVPPSLLSPLPSLPPHRVAVWGCLLCRRMS
jgi:hypothetical protein